MSAPRVRVKVCGLTRAEDVRHAVACGADALGFVLWSGSPRFVTAEVVAAITGDVPPPVARVGVFVNASVDEVAAAVSVARLTAVQLHGEEAVEQFLSLGVDVIKVIDVSTDEGRVSALALPARALPLVDAVDPRRGGTGKVADWGAAAHVAAQRPLALAGGLNQENVQAAIAAVRPFLVDVSSGVETAPGIKDAAKVRAFLAAARAATMEGM